MGTSFGANDVNRNHHSGPIKKDRHHKSKNLNTTVYFCLADVVCHWLLQSEEDCCLLYLSNSLNFSSIYRLTVEHLPDI